MSNDELTIQASQQFVDLMKNLKGPAGKQLRSELNKTIRTQAKPVVAAVQDAVLGIPVGASRNSAHGGGTADRQSVALLKIAGGRAAISESGKRSEARLTAKRAAGGFGLRATVAKSVRVAIRDGGVRIAVDTSKLPADEKNMPKALDARAGWRHPTFGHEPWVTQHGSPWFSSTITKHVDLFRQGIAAAMKTVAKKATNL